MKNVTIIGATGFGGLGLIEILLRHPAFSLKQLIARKNTGVPISRVFPHLKGWCDMPVDPPEQIDCDTDLFFCSTPDRAGMELMGKYPEQNIPVIDFSGDFRFSSQEDYAAYAKNKGLPEEHLAPIALEKAVYGLPEKNREKIAKAKITGNPGCFAISMILGLLPATEHGLTKGPVVCDGKTGVSGAGISSGEANLYPQRHENINAYREGRHQHVVEVERTLGLELGSLLFVPQIVPVSRGILMNIYADLKSEISSAQLLELYRDYYRNEPFVMVTESSPATAEVIGSNRCVVRPAVHAPTGKLLVTAVIDNLMKGQSGNAVQNANIMMGIEETAGLDRPGYFP